jgi:AraC-like DNA-binding protein
MPDYFDYFPAPSRPQAWGIHSTSFGSVRVAPGAVYPPARHPGRHQLGWERGRTLTEYQILFIHKGRGEFESARTRSQAIGDGMAFVLFPGVWHRCRPDPAVGWTESWLEVQGPMLDKLRRAGALDPRRPVYRTPPVLEVERLFEAAAALARVKPPGFTVRLGLLAAEILALLRWSPRSRKSAPRRIDLLISESQAMLAGNFAGQPSLEEVARKLGLGYSYFRRCFKAQTGLSPKQYRMSMRHHEAKRLLLNSELTVKEISERLAYYSPFHLSQEFSRLAGVSPQQWRKRK